MSLQVELLEQSFEEIKPYADAFVNSFYENLFTAYPEAKPLFTTTNMAEQKKKLLASLVLVVENLRKPDALINTLRGLGARHVKYGALPEHYPLVGNALLTTFEQYLGDKWTPEVKQAWVDAYGAISEIMLDGADYSQTDIVLDAPVNSTEEAEIPEESGLQIELLEQSFAGIRSQADAFVNSFYENLFTAYPEAKPLFRNTDVPEQKTKLLAALVLIVENLRTPEVLVNTLKGLGARHVKYGVLPKHYPCVGNSLLTTFEQYLGDNWTPEVKQAWVDAYGAISEIMLDGADYSQADIALEASVKTKDESLLDIELIESSFAQIRPRLSEFAGSFYRNLFILYPETKPLFASTDMKAQEQKLVDSLILVVLNLRQPGFLTDALRSLGTRHIQYGALPEHYPLVGNALLTTFDQYLNSDWTPEVKQAWIDAYNLISKIMLEGAEYSPSDLAIETVPTPSESADKSFIEQENDDAQEEVNNSSVLSVEDAQNNSSLGLLAGFVAGSGLLIVLFILL
ncbi:MAG: globin family protein [Xenococcaceae cyanobacterium]